MRAADCGVSAAEAAAAGVMREEPRRRLADQVVEEVGPWLPEAATLDEGPT